MKSNKSNKELLLKIKDDDKVAFYNIYERYCNRLFSFVLRYLKLESDAEEIVQEVFVKIWESRNNINPDSSFEAYLFTIAYNTTINLLRKRVNEKKYLEHLASVQEINSAPELIDEIYFNELSNKIREQLNKVTPRQKEIFMLSREKGLSNAEIAEKLGISVLTVKKHISNTLAFLKSGLDKSMFISVLFVYMFLK